jgi:hypothetical protein
MTIRETLAAARAAVPGARYMSFNPAALAEALGYTAPWNRAGVPDVYDGLAMGCDPDQIAPVEVSATAPADYHLSVWFKVWSVNQRTCMRAANWLIAEQIGAVLFGEPVINAVEFTAEETDNIAQTVIGFCNGAS